MIKIGKTTLNYFISRLYSVGSWFYHWRFDVGISRVKSFSMPIITVGNIAVGGTGKTPHIEWLLAMLQETYQTAVISRGYKRKTKGYRLANSTDTAITIGDEPFQMLQKYPNTHFVVSENRVVAVQRLCEDKHDTAVILLDDAFQHRRIVAGLSILLTTYENPFFRDSPLPYGELRERRSAVKRADIILVTKCPATLTSNEKETFKKRIAHFSDKKIYFSSLVYTSIYPIFGGVPIPEKEYGEREVLLLTAIANTSQIEAYVATHFQLKQKKYLPDHYLFTAKDIATLQTNFVQLRSNNGIIITTEKDAARLEALAKDIPSTLKPYLYTLPMQVALDEKENQSLTKTIKDYVKTNQRNGRLY